LHRAIAAYADEAGVESPVVEVELVDSARFVLSRIDAAPGFGMVTLRVAESDGDAPDVLIVPIGSIKRLELRKAPEERLATFGFAVSRPS
jgi:hypothetical protein